jgi:hypothetical protein
MTTKKAKKLAAVASPPATKPAPTASPLPTLPKVGASDITFVADPSLGPNEAYLFGTVPHDPLTPAERAVADREIAEELARKAPQFFERTCPVCGNVTAEPRCPVDGNEVPR